jgi:hypothetical protein
MNAVVDARNRAPSTWINEGMALGGPEFNPKPRMAARLAEGSRRT